MIEVMNNKRRVAIIGGGITGLVAAYHLQQQMLEKKLPLEIVIFEASHRFGGKIQTLIKDDYLIETGPDSFTDHRGIVAELAAKLNIKNQLVSSKEDKKFVAVNEELYAVPQGVQFGIPTKMKPFMASDLVSWSGKARAILDFLRPHDQLASDQSLGKWMRKRLGDEVVENITEPVLSSIYNGDIDQLSLEAVLPFLKEFGNSSNGLIGAVRSYTQDPSYLINHQQSFSFIGGLSRLVVELESQLTEVKLKKSVRVTSIEKMGEQLKLSLNNLSTVNVDAVLIAAPHTVAQTLLKNKDVLSDLKDIPLNTVATVSFVFDEGQISKEFTGTDFVVSRKSDISITSASFLNRKWPNIVPAGKELIKLYVGKVGDEAIVELSDKEIEKVVLQDLHRLIGLTGAPSSMVVTRFKNAIPQYIVGHAERIRSVKEKLYEVYPTVRVAGNSYDGISLPKCISQAEANAEALLNELF